MDKDYVKGRAFKKEFQNGGHVIKVAIPIDEIERIKHNGWINISIAEMRTPLKDKTGKLKTHYMVNDNAMPPEGSKDHPQYTEPKEMEVENIPF